MATRELLIYDVIGEDFFGEGVSAKGVIAELKDFALGPEDELIVRVNSPGGSVFDALAIYNALLAYPANVVARVEGVAASAASLILQAANVIEVAEASFLMIHRAHALAMGSAVDMLELAATLEKHDEVIAGIYARRSGRPESEWLDLMDAETWFTGAEAIEAKLADSLTDVTVPTASEARPQNSARLNLLGRYRNVPAALRSPEASTPEPKAAPAATTDEIVDAVVARLDAREIEAKAAATRRADLAFLMEVETQVVEQALGAEA